MLLTIVTLSVPPIGSLSSCAEPTVALVWIDMRLPQVSQVRTSVPCSPPATEYSTRPDCIPNGWVFEDELPPEGAVDELSVGAGAGVAEPEAGALVVS